MAKSASKSSRQSKAVATKRYRPLGLSIAILFTMLLYGFWPIMPVALVLWVNTRRSGLGMEILSQIALINAGIGAITLVASVIAWIGRPSWSRWTLILLVWIATISRLLEVGQEIFGPRGAVEAVGGSFSGLGQSYAVCQVPLLIFIPLYITWYMNRAPARAFYGQAK